VGEFASAEARTMFVALTGSAWSLAITTEVVKSLLGLGERITGAVGDHAMVEPATLIRALEWS
jgi:hypothetical protein